MEFGELLTSGTRGRTPLDSPAFCPSGIGCGNLNPQASSEASLPRHGLKTQSVTSVKLGEKKDRFAHLLKVANRSFVVAKSPIEGVAACRRGSEASPSGDSKGRSPWRAFGDFPRDGKVTRVPSMALPCSRGAPASGEAGTNSDNLLSRGPHLRCPSRIS